jgi:hypothetical protein
MRSVMTSGIAVSSSAKTVALAGRVPSASTVKELPSGGRSWLFEGGACAAAIEGARASAKAR